MSSCSDNTCGIGGWGGPLPGDPDNNSILSATPAFGGIDVSWSYPVTNPNAVAHTLLYRGLLPQFDAAIQHQVVAGNFFYDKIDTPTRYYYWIRIVSVNGTVGELIGPASAVAKPTIAGVIEQLTGMIDAGYLAQSLKAKLDEISVLNSNLLNEITSRENSEITLAEALEEVNAGVAQALTFIHEEINSRTTADSAIAEQLNILAATLNDQYAAVIQTMRVDIDALTGKTNAIWSAQVNVNGLIGGFGLVGDGETVEAGFDVDRFWVGRTNANKRKPFIIDNGVTYIDEGVIRSLTFSKLRDEAGAFVVENGKLKASYVAATYLSSISSDLGQVNLTSFNGDWAFLRTPGKWLDNNWGFVVAQNPNGSMFMDLAMNGAGMRMYHNAGVSATFELYGPGFRLSESGLTISALNVIGTAQVQGNAITVPWAFQRGDSVAFSNTNVGQPAGYQAYADVGGAVQCFGGPMVCIGNMQASVTGSYPGSGDSEGGTYAAPTSLFLFRNGVQIWSGTGALLYVDSPGPGVFTYELRAYATVVTGHYGVGFAGQRTLLVLETRR